MRTTAAVTTAIVLAAAVLASTHTEAKSLLPNGSFEAGSGTAPVGWTLVGKGAWLPHAGRGGSRCVAVFGDGKGTYYWRCKTPTLKPGGVYVFSYWYRTDKSAQGGCVISGPNFANDDHGLTQRWRLARFAFTSPSKPPQDSYVRVGLWTTRGRAYFDDLSLLPAIPVHRRYGNITLGEGETIDGKSYNFSHNFGGFANNYARPLAEFTAGFNSNRWVFSPGQYVVYRHSIPGATIAAAKVSLEVGYYESGTCIVEASADGHTWRVIGRAGKLGTYSFPVPAEMLPAQAVRVRLRASGRGAGRRADSAPGNFQVHHYTFGATLNKSFAKMAGATTVASVLRTDPSLAADIQQFDVSGNKISATVAVTNRGPASPITLEIAPSREGRPLPPTKATATVPAGATKTLQATCQLERPGEYAVELRIRRGARVAFLAATTATVPELWDSSFGYLIASDKTADLWWCEGSWKVGRDRPAPSKRRPTVYLEACRDEFEPVQVVIRPRRRLTGLRVTVSDLHAPAGWTIPSRQISIKQVVYVYVWRPTDRFGAVGWWPDPLPPVGGPLQAEAGRNLPLWLTVHVPRLARPGIYDGTVTLSADGGWRAVVPLRLRVFAFSLPREFHIQTALGIGQGNIWRYHNLTAPEDQPLREKVWDLYMQDWRDHHISPYQFWLHPFEVKIEGYAWGGGHYTSSTAHSGRQCIVVVDDQSSANPAASAAKLIPVDRTKTYILRVWAKTKTDGQQFMVTVGQHQANGKWIPNNNMDFTFTGTTHWRKYEVTITPARFNKRTAQVGVTLRGSKWVPDGSTTGTTWFDDVYFGLAPNGPNLLPDPSFEKTPDQATVSIDWTQWDREARKYLDGYHFNSFRLPIMGLGGGRYPRYDKGRLGPFEFGTPEYEKLMGKYLRLIQDHLEQNGWLEKAYIYWYDEPSEKDYPFVVERMRLIKRLAPKLTRMLTEQPEEPLYGAVDLWCPVLSAYRPDRCHARQRLGERVWWYVCTGPKAPWLGLFIDHPHTDMRAWLWATWKWNVQGCLIWTTDWWTCGGLFGSHYQNPWEDPMSYTSGSRPGHVSYWGNGDGRFFYPPNRKAWKDRQTKYVTGPVDSYRWEQLREGLEDWEYLYTLSEIVRRRSGPAAERARRLLEVPREIMGDNATQYTHTPEPILRRRHEIAEAIEQLMRH